MSRAQRPSCLRLLRRRWREGGFPAPEPVQSRACAGTANIRGRYRRRSHDPAVGELEHAGSDSAVAICLILELLLAPVTDAALVAAVVVFVVAPAGRGRGPIPPIPLRLTRTGSTRAGPRHVDRRQSIPLPARAGSCASHVRWRTRGHTRCTAEEGDEAPPPRSRWRSAPECDRWDIPSHQSAHSGEPALAGGRGDTALGRQASAGLHSLPEQELRALLRPQSGSPVDSHLRSYQTLTNSGAFLRRNSTVSF